eukprot:9074848-Pyramimonas_sp.AAC.1
MSQAREPVWDSSADPPDLSGNGAAKSKEAPSDCYCTWYFTRKPLRSLSEAYQKVLISLSEASQKPIQKPPGSFSEASQRPLRSLAK